MGTEAHKPEGLVNKIITYACCCQSDLCRECCQWCWDGTSPVNNKPRKLSKSDIQHIINHQPASRLQSTTSQASSAGSALNSPSYARERFDSENSSGSRTSSRKGSTSSEYRSGSTSSAGRSNPTPIIDMKPIEFWAAKEAIQPRAGPKRRLPSEREISVEDLKPDLYEREPDSGSDECLTDEQKLARFKLGQVHFSLQYQVPSKCLLVKVIEARDLPLPYSQDVHRQDMAHSNPYAKVSLLPEHVMSQQTSVQRKTQNPVWGEGCRFEIPFKEVQKRSLEVVVKDFDKFSRHCVIGQVQVKLEDINIIKGGHMWKPLLPSNTEQADLGEILLSLNYLPSAGRLTVDVMKAKQLLQTDLIGGSDPFVKISFCYGDKSLKTKKTTTKKNTIDPVFNESVNFNITPEQLSSCSLVVTVWDHNSKSRDDFVGRIVLGKYATGTQEVTHWKTMIQCQRSPVAQWHVLRTREECDKKCPITITS